MTAHAATKTVAAIALGSNQGDRLLTLRHATAAIGSLGTILATSPIYETDPVGYLDQPAFLNAALLLETTLPALDLLRGLHVIEREMGRVRVILNGPRTIDLDLLLFGEHSVDAPGLTVPHPRMHERAFVLVPLHDIAEDMVHPVLQKTVGELLSLLGEQAGFSKSEGSLT